MNNSQKNHILAKLSKEEYQRLSKALKPVQLSRNEVLLGVARPCESVYFPTKGIVSILSIMEDGSTAELALIGTEGMVGIFPFLGSGTCNSCAIVQIKGEAMRLDVNTLQEEFERDETLNKLMLSYALTLFNQVSQTAGCNNRHTVQQRTARWLLMIDDRTEEDTFSMTQELISQMLGVRRTGVTEIAKNMQRQGIIDYHRGQMRILDRSVLKAVACECYEASSD